MRPKDLQRAVLRGDSRSSGRRNDHRLLPALVAAEGQGGRRLPERCRDDRDRRHRAAAVLVDHQRGSRTGRRARPPRPFVDAPPIPTRSTTTPSSTAWSSMSSDLRATRPGEPRTAGEPSAPTRKDPRRDRHWVAHPRRFPETVATEQPSAIVTQARWHLPSATYPSTLRRLNACPGMPAWCRLGAPTACML